MPATLIILPQVPPINYNMTVIVIVIVTSSPVLDVLPVDWACHESHVAIIIHYIAGYVN